MLNRKAPREAFGDFIDRLGDILLAESARLAESTGPVRDFLEANPLPSALSDRLPAEFRVFCLALNSLKQWVAAEQAATDRYLLGGNARKLCRKAADTCVITGHALEDVCELHHPVRDGRPPIPISKAGHAEIEGEVAVVGDGPIGLADELERLNTIPPGGQSGTSALNRETWAGKKKSIAYRLDIENLNGDNLRFLK